MSNIAVTGGRDFTNWSLLFDTLRTAEIEAGNVLTVKVGDCPTGADFFTKLWAYAADYHYYITDNHLREFKAEWSKYGHAAGPIRNHKMINDGPLEVVYAFPTDRSRGTIECVDYAANKGIKIRFPEMEKRDKHGYTMWDDPIPKWFSWAREINGK